MQMSIFISPSLIDRQSNIIYEMVLRVWTRYKERSLNIFFLLYREMV